MKRSLAVVGVSFLLLTGAVGISTARRDAGGPMPTLADAGGPMPTLADAGGPMPTLADAGGPMPTVS
jgi:hypothetical protein